MVRDQIEAALNDIGADAIKIGMLANAASSRRRGRSAAGNQAFPWCWIRCWYHPAARRCWTSAGIEILKSRLLPRATLVTPNLAGMRSRWSASSPQDDHAICAMPPCFRAAGRAAVLFKGGHGDGATVARRAVRSADRHSVAFRIAAPGHAPHPWHGLHACHRDCLRPGAGSAPCRDAVREAHDFVQNAIRTAPGLGHGHGPLNL